MNPRENYLRVIFRNHPDHIPFPGEPGLAIISSAFVERPILGGFDDWGCLWDYSEVTGSYPSASRKLIKLEEIDNFEFPDPYRPGLFQPFIRKLEEIGKEENLVIGVTDFGLFERSWLLVGMDNLLIGMIDTPELVKKLFKKIADFKIAMATQFMKLGADGVWFGDDWGTQNGLFMSPSVWRELIKPEQARMYNAVKELNGIVFQHSCGCIEAIVGDLIEIGMDVWHPAQPCNNLALLKQKYGNKMCFMGAIDSQYVLPLGSTEEVREEVRRRIKELGKDGGYIPLPSHEIPFPKENWEAMIDEIKKIKKYPT